MTWRAGCQLAALLEGARGGAARGGSRGLETQLNGWGNHGQF